MCTISDYHCLVNLPPKSDYWKYFVVQGILAICQLPGCPKPNVSLGALPKGRLPIKKCYFWALPKF